MKQRIIMATVGIAALFAFTNPDMPDYEQYLRKEIVQNSQNSDVVTQTVSTLFSGLASGLIVNFTTRTNFLLFSLYETNMAQNHYKVLGALDNFVVIQHK